MKELKMNRAVILCLVLCIFVFTACNDGGKSADAKSSGTDAGVKTTTTDSNAVTMDGSADAAVGEKVNPMVSVKVRASEYAFYGPVYDGYVTVGEKADRKKKNVMNLADGKMFFDDFQSQARYLRHGYFYSHRTGGEGWDAKIYDSAGKLVCDKIEGNEFFPPTEFIGGRSKVTLLSKDGSASSALQSDGKVFSVYIDLDFNVVRRDERWIPYRENATVAIYGHEVQADGKKETITLCGLVDSRSFEPITEPIFKNCAPFVGKYTLAVSMDSHLCVIDQEGETVYNLSEALASEKERLGEINLNVINPYDEKGFAVNFENSDGVKKVAILDGDFKIIRVIDGSEVGIDAIREFRGELAVVDYQGRHGLIDRNGNIILSPEYDFICPFDGSYTYAKKGEDYFIVTLE